MELGVVHLSDLCSSDDILLNRPFLDKDMPMECRNVYNWSIKHHVSSTDMTAWMKFLKAIFTWYNYPLGDWV